MHNDFNCLDEICELDRKISDLKETNEKFAETIQSQQGKIANLLLWGEKVLASLVPTLPIQDKPDEFWGMTGKDYRQLRKQLKKMKEDV